VQYSKILIITCNIPEVDGDVVGVSSVGQYGGGGHVHDTTVVSGAHVTTGHCVLSSVDVVVSELNVVSSVDLVVSVTNVLSSDGVVASEINVVSSVGQVQDNIVGSVVDVTSGDVTSEHVTSIGLVTSGHCVISSVVFVVSAVYVVSSVGHEHGNVVVSVVPAGETLF
jgi:hypothetical protein